MFFSFYEESDFPLKNKNSGFNTPENGVDPQENTADSTNNSVNKLENEVATVNFTLLFFVCYFEMFGVN